MRNVKVYAFEFVSCINKVNIFSLENNSYEVPNYYLYSKFEFSMFARNAALFLINLAVPVSSHFDKLNE